MLSTFLYGFNTSDMTCVINFLFEKFVQEFLQLRVIMTSFFSILMLHSIIVLKLIQLTSETIDHFFSSSICKTCIILNMIAQKQNPICEIQTLFNSDRCLEYFLSLFVFDINSVVCQSVHLYIFILNSYLTVDDPNH